MTKLIAPLWPSLGVLLKYCIYCVSMPSLRRESTNSLILLTHSHHVFHTAADLFKDNEKLMQNIASSTGEGPHQPRNCNFPWRSFGSKEEL